MRLVTPVLCCFLWAIGCGMMLEEDPYAGPNEWVVWRQGRGSPYPLEDPGCSQPQPGPLGDVDIYVLGREGSRFLHRESLDIVDRWGEAPGLVERTAHQRLDAAAGNRLGFCRNRYRVWSLENSALVGLAGLVRARRLLIRSGFASLVPPVKLYVVHPTELVTVRADGPIRVSTPDGDFAGRGRHLDGGMLLNNALWLRSDNNTTMIANLASSHKWLESYPERAYLASPAVFSHEYGHHIFAALEMASRRATAEQNPDVSLSAQLMASWNEGFADLIAYYAWDGNAIEAGRLSYVLGPGRDVAVGQPLGLSKNHSSVNTTCDVHGRGAEYAYFFDSLMAACRVPLAQRGEVLLGASLALLGSGALARFHLTWQQHSPCSQSAVEEPLYLRAWLHFAALTVKQLRHSLGSGWSRTAENMWKKYRYRAEARL